MFGGEPARSADIALNDSKTECAPARHDVVRTPDDAIRLARIYWFSALGTKPDKIPEENAWLSSMQAHLAGDTWEVTARDVDKTTVGGAIFISVSRHDGRLLGLHLTQ